MKTGIVYKVTSPSGKFYIGKTTQGLSVRRIRHISEANCGKKTKFNNAIRKYGDQLKWEVLYNNIPEDQLDVAEMCAIYTFDSYDNGYNGTFGGEGHTGPLSEEHKKNISIARTGTKASDEAKKNMSLANGRYWLGKEFPLEMRQKMSESRKGCTPWNVGITHSPETRKKISDKKKGRPSWNKGIPFSQESRQRMSISQKKSENAVGDKNPMSFVSIMNRYNCNLEEAKNIRKDIFSHLRKK